MKDILKLMRIKHWIKNFLIYIPIVFAKILNVQKYLIVSVGWVAMSLMASAIYIINDIEDVEKDREHEVKRNRPIASGRVSIQKARIVAITLSLASFLLTILVAENRISTVIMMILYLFLNVAYSMGLKNKPILDVVILASGFVIRVLYGGEIVNISVSPILILTVTAFALYMGLGKRRNEKRIQKKETRTVLKLYTDEFLDKNMYMCMALGITFYSMWTLSVGNDIVYTAIAVIVICMRYSFIIERGSSGDPVDVLLSDGLLLVLVVLFVFFVAILLF